MTRSLCLIPTLALLAACATPPLADAPMPVEPGGGIGDTPDSCGLAQAQAFIGQPPEAVNAALFTQPVRVIRPGDLVTMDFNPERLNFRVGEDGLIESVDCG